MSEGRFVLTRIGQTLIVTLESSADAGSLYVRYDIRACISRSPLCPQKRTCSASAVHVR
jgi:hypothetical protein